MGKFKFKMRTKLVAKKTEPIKETKKTEDAISSKGKQSK